MRFFTKPDTLYAHSCGSGNGSVGNGSKIISESAAGDNGCGHPPWVCTESNTGRIQKNGHGGNCTGSCSRCSRVNAGNKEGETDEQTTGETGVKSKPDQTVYQTGCFQNAGNSTRPEPAEDSSGQKRGCGSTANLIEIFQRILTEPHTDDNTGDGDRARSLLQLQR